jgi:hypothetical protein
VRRAFFLPVANFTFFASGGGSGNASGGSFFLSHFVLIIFNYETLCPPFLPREKGSEENEERLPGKETFFGRRLKEAGTFFAPAEEARRCRGNVFEMPGVAGKHPHSKSEEVPGVRRGSGGFFQ